MIIKAIHFPLFSSRHVPILVFEVDRRAFPMEMVTVENFLPISDPENSHALK